MKRRRKGFTLVELMVVIAIMAILAAASVPVFSGYLKKAKATTHLAECRTIYISAATYIEEMQAGNTAGEASAKDIDMDELLKEVKELTGIKNIEEGSRETARKGLGEGYYIYVEDRESGPACTSVVYSGKDTGTWVFDTENGSFKEMK